jgi:hypothetical protein
MELWYAFRTASQSAAANIDTGGTYVNGASPAWTTTATNTLLVGAIGPNSGNLTATAPWVAISFASAFNTLVYKIVSSTQSSAPLVATDTYFGAVVTAFK